ncbi:SUMO-interacting motif-containing protein 1 isoform X2 [Rana temporaria]|uniref:SUMO-interacting motif-containing protein 1 isoform X2 n=1 Tax=Rana temporaria TaxID=8407 RepID=UPI001AACCD3E|nr:SUMO-interacting motif-containing protein 1 isoform X2 [Rana temporaria]
MEDTIVISDDEGEEPRGAWLLSQSPDCDIIDLTINHTTLENLPELDNGVIDLTANEDGLGLSPGKSPFKDEPSNSDSNGDMYFPSNSSSGVISENEEGTSEFSWRTDSETNSIENGLQNRDVPTSWKDKCLADEVSTNCLVSKADIKEHSDSTLQEWPPLPTPASGESSSDFAIESPNQFDARSMPALPTVEETNMQQPPINKALLYKLRCFKKPPVSHFFHKLDKSKTQKPIPQSRMSIVNNTREESIHQGTLHFLSEFVTAEHYPPKDTVMYVIQSILLGEEEQAIKHEAYMILMKMQKLHPASVNTVAWNWSLLSGVMERKETHTYYLFLHYVVQTLDDNYQKHLNRRSFQKSLCKAMLSCDKPNIKDVIAWLIHAVENACGIAVDRELDAPSECEQRVVFLLQRMLTIAVEVDDLPVTNSNRIADLLFPYVIVLKTRQQRELFFSSTENHLLRAKILELIFLNSCESMPPRDLPLSLCKILHFIGNSTLLLENQNAYELQLQTVPMKSFGGHK